MCVHAETADETAHRVLVLEKLADCCLSLGAYHIAAKKFTQAGNQVKVCVNPNMIQNLFCTSIMQLLRVPLLLI